MKTFFKLYSPDGDFAAPQHRKDGLLGMHCRESQFPVLMDCCEEELLWWLLVSFPLEVSTWANERQLQQWQHSSRAFWSPRLCPKKSSKYNFRQTCRALGWQNFMSLSLIGDGGVEVKEVILWSPGQSLRSCMHLQQHVSKASSVPGGGEEHSCGTHVPNNTCASF